jgi:stage II sporulation protein E
MRTATEEEKTAALPCAETVTQAPKARFSRRGTGPNLFANVPRKGRKAGILALGFLLGAGFSQSALAGSAALGIALLLAWEKADFLWALGGVLAGTALLLPTTGPAPLLGIALAAVASRLFLRFGVSKRDAAVAGAGICALAAGLLHLITAETAGAAGWAAALGGAAFAGAAAHYFTRLPFIRRSLRTQEPGKKHTAIFSAVYTLTAKDCVTALVCVALLLAALGSIGFPAAQGGFRAALQVAQILGAALILPVALYGQEIGGAAMGAAVGAGLVLGGAEPYLLLVCAAGGLVAGICAPQSPASAPKGTALRGFSEQLRVCAGFLPPCLAYVFLEYRAGADILPALRFLFEVLGGCLLFLFIGGNFWREAAACFSFAGAADPARTRGAETGLRLRKTAAALEKVGADVAVIVSGLEKLTAPAHEQIAAKTEQGCCRDCPEYVYCWVDNLDKTTAALDTLIRLDNAGSRVDAADLAAARADAGLPAPCRDPLLFCDKLSRACQNYAARVLSHRREQQLRLAAADQFAALGRIMADLDAQNDGILRPDATAALAARAMLIGLGWHVGEVSCVRGAAGAAKLMFSGTAPETRIHAARLTKELSAATGIDFAQPDLQEEERNPGREIFLSFAEKTRFCVEQGAVQLSGFDAKYCGDYFDSYDDGGGLRLFVLSDGMGTGGRAAVDAALATEVFASLTKAGVGLEAAMQTVNAAMMLKSCEESLATLDIAAINLYTGELTLLKAGATVSYVLQKDTARRIELSALPAGILRDIQPAQAILQLEPGDVTVLMSDGMTGKSDAWIGQMLEAWAQSADGANMQSLAEKLAKEAVRQWETGKHDDITVICVRLDCAQAQKTQAESA